MTGDAARVTATPNAIDTLASRVAGLFFSFRDPEAFHVEKHSIAREMHRLAEAMRRGAA